MDKQARRNERGFTILELMVAVAIIGILAAVAIPSFRTYQWKAKRSEAYMNLAALANSQKAFHALHDNFVGVFPPEPGQALGNTPGADARDSSALGSAFGEIGWAAEGEVYYDYETNSAAIACGCEKCFTATAFGDVDGDNSGSAVMYVHPDNAGNACPSVLFGYTAPIDATSAPIYDQVAVNQSIDDF